MTEQESPRIKAVESTSRFLLNLFGLEIASSDILDNHITLRLKIDDTTEFKLKSLEIVGEFERKESDIVKLLSKYDREYDIHTHVSFRKGSDLLIISIVF